MLLQVALALASIHLSHTLIILPSRDAGSVGLAFMGRSDMQPADYVSFLQGLQASLSESHNTSATVVIAANLAELQTGVASASGQYGVQRWFGTGHSMSGGGAALQDFVRANSTTFSGLILIAAFAKRTQRPDVRACLAKATVQPQRSVKGPLPTALSIHISIRGRIIGPQYQFRPVLTVCPLSGPSRAHSAALPMAHISATGQTPSTSPCRSSPSLESWTG